MAKRPGGAMVQSTEATRSQLIPVITKWHELGRARAARTSALLHRWRFSPCPSVRPTRSPCRSWARTGNWKIPILGLQLQLHDYAGYLPDHGEPVLHLPDGRQSQVLVYPAGRVWVHRLLSCGFSRWTMTSTECTTFSTSRWPAESPTPMRRSSVIHPALPRDRVFEETVKALPILPWYCWPAT